VQVPPPSHFFSPPFFFPFFTKTFIIFTRHHEIIIEVSTWCEFHGLLNHPIHTKHLEPPFASNFYEPSPIC
jgi:hypothetical protein